MRMPTAEMVRAPYGALLLLAPARVLSLVARAPLDSASVRVARALGARHLAQAVIVASHPTAARRWAGALVDAAHAGSMLALAHWSDKPLHRRLARANATTASLFALAEGAAGAGGLRAETAGIE